MKKRLILLLLFVTIMGMTACSDQKYTDDTVTVIFFTSNFGSTEVESYFNVEPNSLIEPPEDPERQGFLFEGWYKDINATIPWDFETDMVKEKSMVLYAGWDPMEFEIIYDLNEGTMITSDYPTVFTPGENKILPVASRTGYQFVAWYTYDWVDESSTIPGDKGYQILPKEQYEDLYLYAHYKAVEARVTFRSNYPEEIGGPDNPDSQVVQYGSEIDFALLDNTEDYEFVGWNTRPDGTGTFYNNGDLFERTQRITLYGVWELIE